MRSLPYAKALIARRAAGERPWLVVVTMGNEADRKLMRMGAFDGDAEVARIWVPDDFQVADADLSWVVGLDVFVAPFCDFRRSGDFLVALWRARCATLWVLDGKTEQDRGGRWFKNMAKFTATRCVRPHRRSNGCIEFDATHHYELPLDGTFRAKVESARDMALIVSDPPLFDAAAFESARASRLRELGLPA